MLPIFRMIQKASGVPEAELFQVFNMGIGMILLVAAERAAQVLKFILEQGQEAWLIGEVLKGNGDVTLV